MHSNHLSQISLKLGRRLPMCCGQNKTNIGRHRPDVVEAEPKVGSAVYRAEPSRLPRAWTKCSADFAPKASVEPGPKLCPRRSIRPNKQCGLAPAKSNRNRATLGETGPKLAGLTKHASHKRTFPEENVRRNPIRPGHGQSPAPTSYGELSPQRRPMYSPERHMEQHLSPSHHTASVVPSLAKIQSELCEADSGRMSWFRTKTGPALGRFWGRNRAEFGAKVGPSLVGAVPTSVNFGGCRAHIWVPLSGVNSAAQLWNTCANIRSNSAEASRTSAGFGEIWEVGVPIWSNSGQLWPKSTSILRHLPPTFVDLGAALVELGASSADLGPNPVEGGLGMDLGPTSEHRVKAQQSNDPTQPHAGGQVAASAHMGGRRPQDRRNPCDRRRPLDRHSPNPLVKDTPLLGLSRDRRRARPNSAVAPNWPEVGRLSAGHPGRIPSGGGGAAPYTRPGCPRGGG